MTVTSNVPYSYYSYNMNQAPRSPFETELSRPTTTNETKSRGAMDTWTFSSVHRPLSHEGVPRDNIAYGCLVKVGDTLEWHDTKAVYDHYGIDGLAEYYRKEDGTVYPDVTEFLDLVKDFKTQRTEMQLEVNKLAKRCGISGTDIKKLKIEMKSSGKIFVGGLADDVKTKKLQEVLNNEDGFKHRLKTYQDKDAVVTNQVNGMFKSGIMEDRTSDGMWGMEYLEYRAKLDGVDNLDGLGPNALVFAAAEIFRDDIESADFSFNKKGMANPEATIQGKLTNIRNWIRADLGGVNTSNRMASSDNTIAPEDVVSLDNVKFKITESGEITIEGRFAKSDRANAEAYSVAMQRLQDELAKTTVNGGESHLLTAVRQLRISHDEEFGESIGLKKGTVVFGEDYYEASVENPAAVFEVEREIQNTVLQAVKQETGLELERGDVEIDESGKISIKNVTGINEEQKKLLDTFTASLNGMIAAKEPSANPGDGISQAANRISQLMEELDSYDKKLEGGL